ncbi:MAG: membrane-like protein [Pseudomonadota bacterium]|uniref:membrane-like protein n=1 Tax=Sphingobium naphthae TaxID=1886786 RepID=UPI002B1214B4|nr:membrane-like protein [Pseudomonadota bacterium]
MRRAWIALMLALPAGCSEDPPPAVVNKTGADRPAEVVVTPIADETAKADSKSDRPTSVTPLAKPLVSRETSPPPPELAAYRAIGTEPFWAVTVRGDTATLERPDRAAVRYRVREEADAAALRFLGEGFSMTVSDGPCSDGMSDAIWSDRVQIAFGEGVLKGCGGARDEGRDFGY